MVALFCPESLAICGIPRYNGYMRIPLLILLMLSFFFAGLSNADVSLWEGANQLRAREKSSGKDLWQSKVQVQEIKDSLHILEEGGGICGREKRYLSWCYESFFKVEGSRFLPEKINVVYKLKNGKTLKTLKKSFDYENKKVICNVNGKNKEFEFKNDLVDRENLGLFLSNYPFEKKNDLSFHLLSHEPSLDKMIIKYKGRETIKNGKNMVECHKLEMKPDLGVLKLLEVFVPKVYFWFESKPPHNFIKYEGLEGGLNSPYIILESRVIPQKSS